MTRTLWLDLETRSRTSIDLGVYKYAADANLDIVLFGYALDDEPAKVVEWPLRAGLPDDLAKALEDPEVICIAHNSAFDRTCLARFAAWCVFTDRRRDLARCMMRIASPERWKDSMVLAMSAGLPAGLKNLCLYFHLPENKAKDADGKRLLRKYCIPDAAGHFGDPSPLDADDWQRFVNYCRLDVEAVREVWRRMPKYNDTPDFWNDWRLDQQINDRGIRIDKELVAACAEDCAAAQKAAADSLSALTDGRVTTAGQRARIIAELRALGVRMPDLQQSTVEHRLNDPSLPPLARQILTARALAGRSSVSKFATLADATNGDLRLRGCFQFCGAARTGRWSGRLFQPQNLPRGELHGEEVDAAIRAFKAGCAPLLYDDVLAAASSCIRGCVIAPAEKILAVADLSNIEGRMLAWLAGEAWKVEAFRAFDRGEGPDIYKATYARTFGGSADDVTKAQRQVGKVLELAMGYGGGVGAFGVFARGFGMDMDAMADLTLSQTDEATLEDARAAYKAQGGSSEMSERVWTACEIVKRRWRAAHPATAALWSAAESAAVEALQGLGVRPVGPHCSIGADADGLYAILPSGRRICWPKACLPDRRKDPTARGVFRFWDATSWANTYGGRIVENLTQAAARDILMHGMRRAEAAGLEVVMHVHDELICEASTRCKAPEKKLAECMAKPPAWASDLPLAAAGFAAQRYRKD